LELNPRTVEADASRNGEGRAETRDTKSERTGLGVTYINKSPNKSRVWARLTAAFRSASDVV